MFAKLSVLNYVLSQIPDLIALLNIPKEASDDLILNGIFGYSVEVGKVDDGNQYRFSFNEHGSLLKIERAYLAGPGNIRYAIHASLIANSEMNLSY